MRRVHIKLHNYFIFTFNSIKIITILLSTDLREYYIKTPSWQSSYSKHYELCIYYNSYLSTFLLFL